MKKFQVNIKTLEIRGEFSLFVCRFEESIFFLVSVEFFSSRFDEMKFEKA